MDKHLKFSLIYFSFISLEVRPSTVACSVLKTLTLTAAISNDFVQYHSVKPFKDFLVKHKIKAFLNFKLKFL